MPIIDFQVVNFFLFVICGCCPIIDLEKSAIRISWLSVGVYVGSPNLNLCVVIVHVVTIINLYTCSFGDCGFVSLFDNVCVFSI